MSQRRQQLRQRRLSVQRLERRELLTAELVTEAFPLPASAALIAEGESTQTVSDSGGFEGSNRTISLGRNGGGKLRYSYEHFTIPDNFIIRYEGKTLFETGFTGGSSSGTVTVPEGDSDTAQIIVATNDEGTAWNYTVTANSCPQTSPFVIELVGSDFTYEEDANGKGVCKGTGTVIIGREDGIGQMLRIDNATAEFDKLGLDISGTATALIGSGEVLSKPLFSGSFELPFKTGTSSSFTETGAANEFQLGGMDVDFSSISLNRNGIALGAQFELLDEIGFPDYVFSGDGKNGLLISQDDVSFGNSIKFSTPDFKTFEFFGFLPALEFSDFSIEYMAAENAVKIQGELEVEFKSKSPVEEIEIDLTGNNFIQIKGGKADIVGELTVETNLKFPPKGWGLDELKLKIDTINEDVKGSAQVVLPFGKKIEATAEVGFKTSWPLELNSAAVEIDNLNIAIPSYPLVFFQGFRGGFDNFAESDPDPIEFTGGVSATLGPQINGTSLIRVDLDGRFNESELSGTGTVTIVDPELAQSTSTITLNWDEKFFESRGTFNFLDGFIQTSDSFRATSNFDVYMGGSAQITVPESVLLIGGLQLGSANYAVNFTNNGNLADDYAAGWGILNFDAYGLDSSFVIGFKGYFDGRFERIGGDDIPPTNSFTIEPDTEWFIMGADWENEVQGDVPVQVTLPNGTIVQEADFAANNIAVVEELTDSRTKVVLVIDPEPGVWDVEVVDPNGLGEIIYSAAGDTTAPTIELLTPASDISTNEVLVTYNAFDPDSDAEVRLFFDTDQQGFDGVLITGGLTEMDGQGTYQWDTTNLAPGEYYVYAEVRDANNAPAYSYSTGKVIVGQAADVGVTLTGPQSATAGSQFTLGIDVENFGNRSATDTQLEVLLPNDVTFIGTSATGATVNGGVLMIDLGELTASERESLTITLQAPSVAAALATTANITSSSFDSNAANDSASLTTFVDVPRPQLPSLTLSSELSAQSIELGQSMTYTITVKNAGPGVASNVVLLEQLPANARLLNVTVTGGTSRTLFGNRVEVNFGELASGAEAAVTFEIRPRTAGSLVSTSALSSDQQEFASQQNELITVIETEPSVPLQADLDVALTASATQVDVGQTIELSLVLANAGPGVASAIRVSMPLPAGLEFVSANTLQGTYDPQTGIWDVGNVRDNLSRTLVVTARVTTAGDYVINGEVSAVTEQDPDSSPGNGLQTEDDFATVSVRGGTPSPLTRVLRPNSVAGGHFVPAGSLPTAILFRTLENTTVSVVPIGVAILGEALTIVDASMTRVSQLNGGVTEAELEAGGVYAVLIQPQARDRVLMVRSSAGRSALTNRAMTNPFENTDTNGDGITSPVDALVVLNALNRAGDLVAEGEAALSLADVNSDGRISPLDALIVVNRLNRRQLPTGEGELAEPMLPGPMLPHPSSQQNQFTEPWQANEWWIDEDEIGPLVPDQLLHLLASNRR